MDIVKPEEHPIALALDSLTPPADGYPSSEDPVPPKRMESQHPDAYSVLRFIKGNKSKGIELSPSGIKYLN